MGNIKVLIVNKMHPSIFNLLDQIEVDYDYKPEVDQDGVLRIINEYDGIILRSKIFLNRDFFEKAIRLKFICRAGAGIDQIDIDEAEARKILIINAPEGNKDALAEHALGLTLAVLHNIVKSDREVRDKIWDREGNRGSELNTKTVGIYGFGNMGRAFANKVQGLSKKVIAYDIRNFQSIPNSVELVDLDTFKREADIVSLHIPLSRNTAGLVNSHWIESFSKKIWFVNTSRGGVVNTSDLIFQLEEGKIIAAGLDVLENEDLSKLNKNELISFEKLKNMPNVVLTPHIGGWSFESYEKINQVLIDKLRVIIPQIG